MWYVYHLKPRGRVAGRSDLLVRRSFQRYVSARLNTTAGVGTPETADSGFSAPNRPQHEMLAEEHEQMSQSVFNQISDHPVLSTFVDVFHPMDLLDDGPVLGHQTP